MSDRIEPKAKTEQITCRCPFCEGDLAKTFPFCSSCGVTVSSCASCCQPIPQGSEICPNCGAEVKK